MCFVCRFVVETCRVATMFVKLCVILEIVGPALGQASEHAPVESQVKMKNCP